MTLGGLEPERDWKHVGLANFGAILLMSTCWRGLAGSGGRRLRMSTPRMRERFHGIVARRASGEAI